MKAASLNHVYRLVWSHVQNAWTVVAETAKSSGKKSVLVDHSTSNGRLSLTIKSKTKLVVALSMIGMATNVLANPINGQVIYGSASDPVTTGTNMQIDQHSDKLIMNWQSFDIAKGESFKLNQPVNGAALFNILGNKGTEIYGQLTATATLLLINQNGVLFGEGSEVSVGNIIASSLSISNDDFLSGRYHFTGGDNAGSVINQGVIKAKDEGYIVMLGKKVENTGTLVANKGSIVLAAAKEAVLDFYGNGLVRANLTGQAVEAIVKNSGLIQANGGFVQMATNARSAAINISGIVEANQLVERDGMIRLEGGDNAKVQVTGQLIAKGQGTTGGTIEVTGEQVALLNGAVLDTSGDTGGGTILVGGDYQGKNDAVYNSRTTYIAEGVTMKADAIQQGNGGKVVVWGNDLTRYYGSISAQGGAIGGNGGFVEVSGKQNLAFFGKVDVGAEKGIGGTVLLDPENIVLVSGAQPSPTNKGNGTPDVAFADNAGGTTIIQVDDVKGFSELYLQANNDITVSDALTMNTNGKIRFEANNDINVNAALTTSGRGTINLKADADNSGTGNLAIGANITAPGGIVLSAATLTHTAGNINANGDIFGGDPNVPGDVSGHAGNVTITVAGVADLGTANITANGRTPSSFNNGWNGGNVVINAGSLNMTGSINTSGSKSGTTGAPPGLSGVGGLGGNVQITTAGNANVGSITTGAGNAGTVSVASANSGAVSVTSTGGNVTVVDVTTKGGYNATGGNVTLSADQGNVTVTGTINTSGGDARINTNGANAGAVSITAGNNVTTQSIIALGANGNGTDKAGGSTGDVTLTAKTGDINLGPVTVQSGANTGAGAAGNTGKILAQAGQDVILNGDISSNSNAADAVQLVAERNFNNSSNSNITTGPTGSWTVYSDTPVGDVKGANLLASYNYKQYGTSFGGTLLGTGNGFVHKVSPTVTATLNGTSTKVFDGNNTVTDLSGLSVATTGAIDGDVVTVSPLSGATFNDALVGAGKPITGTYNVVSALTAEGKQIFNPGAGTVGGYNVSIASTATGSITAIPVTPTPTGFASPRDDAGLGGLIPNNPILNTMFIVSLNPAAGDEEDLDAVACPTPEDHLGSTPILSSGVKLPDGVNSNCI